LNMAASTSVRLGDLSFRLSVATIYDINHLFP
jgi:hypothetical protein